jgi:hypothetical protein
MISTVKVVLVAVGGAVLVAAVAAIFWPTNAGTISAVATIIAAGGTVVTVIFSGEAARDAKDAAQSADAAADATLRAQASVELPVLTARRDAWNEEASRWENSDNMHRFHAARDRADKAQPRIDELRRFLKLRSEADIESDVHSVWDEVPDRD